MSASRSLFGPLALILVGVLLLVHNVVGSYSFWTTILDYWPWFLVAWGGVRVAQHVVARSSGSPGPARLGGWAVVAAVLICMAGELGRELRANDGIVFRGFGVRVQVRDPAFHPPPQSPHSPPPASNESP